MRQENERRVQGDAAEEQWEWREQRIKSGAAGQEQGWRAMSGASLKRGREHYAGYSRRNSGGGKKNERR